VFQHRVTGVCTGSEFVQKVREDGTVECAAASGGAGGDITGVAAGTGLVGGGANGDVTLGIAPGGVGSLQIADGAVGALDIDPAAVQRRVAGACPVGEFIKLVHPDGTVACGAATGTSGGDITGVTAGTGLAGGGLNGDVTLGIAPGGVGSAQLADGSITAADVNTGQIQRRVLGVCTGGTYFAGIDAAGMPTCSHGTPGTSVALGWTALAANTGLFNTAVGQAALAANTNGQYNAAVGASALTANTTGQHNAAVGASALTANTTGQRNAALGFEALVANTTGNGNVAAGMSALRSNTSGGWNTAIGGQAMIHNLTGNTNVAVGYAALEGNTAADDNVAVGNGALRYNTVSDNTALGAHALYANDTGTDNVAVGARALESNRLGSYATAVGTGALRVASGGLNTALGWHAGEAVTAGFENTAVGYAALRDVTTGARNIAIGTQAGGDLTTGSDNIHIGYQGALNESDTIRIGLQQTRTFIQGIRGITTGGANTVAVVIDGQGQLGTISSSRRTKEDIHDMADASAGIFRLRPVTFRYIQAYADGSKPRDYGLIAEEVDEVYPDLVVRNAAGEVETVQYHKLVPMLLNEVQRLRREVDELRAAGSKQ
jgi:hypothetical protein